MTETTAQPTLLERIAAGDAGAVKECMNAYGGLVWSLARRFSDSLADAEDASQEIFLEVWRVSGRYDRSMGSEATYISTIARRRLIDRLRAKGRRPETEEFDEVHMSGTPASSMHSGEIASDMARAEEALSQLNDSQREIVLLGVVDGLTHSEIATATGKPLGTVKTQMRRGLIRLRGLLEDLDPVASED